MSDNKPKSKIGTMPMVVAVAAGVMAIELLPIASELLRWIVAAIVTIAAFTLCVMIATKNES